MAHAYSPPSFSTRASSEVVAVVGASVFMTAPTVAIGGGEVNDHRSLHKMVTFWKRFGAQSPESTGAWRRTGRRFVTAES